MHFRLWATASLVLLFVSTAEGQLLPVKKGQPSPIDGVVVSDPILESMASDLQVLQDLRGEVEDLKAENETLKSQKSILEDANGKLMQALDLAEKRDQQRELLEQKMLKAIEVNERSIEMAQKAAEVSIKAAETANAALEKMQDKVDKANNRTVFGIIVSAIIGFFSHGLLR